MPDEFKNKAVLLMHLTGETFSQIAEGTKRVEYRSCTPHWKARLENRKYDVIRFRHGYAADAPEMTIEFRGLRRYGKGSEAYYAIRLGRVLKIKRWRKKSE